jgi:hypothetical protein
VPANSLSSNNMWLEATWTGTMAVNANTKALKVYFGSDNWTMVNSTWSGSAWSITAKIFRTGATTQKVVIIVNADGRQGIVTHSTASRTLSSANTLKITGQGGASNDILQETFTLQWHDANS